MKEKNIDEIIKGALSFDLKLSEELKEKTLERIKEKEFIRKIFIIFSVFSILSFILSVALTYFFESIIIKTWIVIFELQLMFSVVFLMFIYKKLGDRFIHKFEEVEI